MINRLIRRVIAASIALLVIQAGPPVTPGYSSSVSHAGIVDISLLLPYRGRR